MNVLPTSEFRVLMLIMDKPATRAVFYSADKLAEHSGLNVRSAKPAVAPPPPKPPDQDLFRISGQSQRVPPELDLLINEAAKSSDTELTEKGDTGVTEMEKGDFVITEIGACK